MADAANRHPSNLGEGIVPQRVDPLLNVLLVFPGWHPVNVHLLSDLFECRDFTLSIEARVQALLGHSAILKRPHALGSA